MQRVIERFNELEHAINQDVSVVDVVRVGREPNEKGKREEGPPFVSSSVSLMPSTPCMRAFSNSPK